ncbi:MAG TPA: WecB/TagA/CpsF family glycosyltransferase [Candidatus Saccharimonadales bacterium]|nr:WecB/TagA/CpsF family glycosyltransferase [Candidatus Saccharimonadales bacterium]
MGSDFRLLGVRIDQVDWAQVDSFCATSLAQKHKNFIVTLNGEIALKASKNLLLKEAINQAGLVIPDSTNIVWAGRMKGGRFKERTPGSDLVMRLCALASENDYSVFLLGGSDDVAKDASEVLIRRFPDLRIVGVSPADPDDLAAVTAVRDARPDILFIAYGSPKQELWLKDHLEELPITLGVGIGGTFDMIAGRLPRAPKIFQALSLEWLWRLILQPTRWRRIWNSVVIFPLKILFS